MKPTAPSAKRALSALLEPGPGKSEPTMTGCDEDMVVHADASSRVFTGDGRPVGPDGRPAVRGVPLDDWALRRAHKASLGPAARVCLAPSLRPPPAVRSTRLAPLVAPVPTELLIKDVIDAETRAKGRAERPARKAAKAQERAAQKSAAAAAQRTRAATRAADAALTALRAQAVDDAAAERARLRLEARRIERAETKLKEEADRAEQTMAKRRTVAVRR